MKSYIMQEIKDSIETKQELLQDQSFIQTMEKVGDICVNAYRKGNKIITCGNGGSASDALHFVGELVGRYRMERSGIDGISLNANVTNMTAIANDYGYDSMFAKQLVAVGNPGDVMFGISTSGNSVIVNNAFRMAKERKIVAVGLLGRDGGQAKELCDYSIIVPSKITSHIQEAHILMIHILAGIIEQALFGHHE